MIAPQPFFEPRGTPISIYQRLHGLSKLGHEVDLVTYSLGQDVTIPHVTIHRVARIPGIDHVEVGPSLAKIPLDILLFIKAFWMLCRQNYDLIHTHEEAAFFGLPLAAVFRTSHLYDMHSSLPKQLANFNFGNYRPFVWLFSLLERWVLNYSEVVVTIGNDLEEHVRRVNPRANHIRIENLAIHVDVPRDAASTGLMKQALDLNGKFPIVYTGTFERYQGLDLLFKSASLVVAKKPEAIFVMVGGKPEQIAYWQEQVNIAGLADHVLFVGTVPLQEALMYLDIAEILVSPRTEGLSIPLKIYSYLHSGKATVATRIEAHTQILNDDIAMLVEPVPAAYAGGILKLIDDQPRRLKLGNEARTYALKQFSASSYLVKLQDVCRAVELRRPIGELDSFIQPLAD